MNRRPTLGSQSRYTVPLSIVTHAAVAAVAVIVPLMAADAIPTPRTVIGAFTAKAEIPQPPPPPAASAPSQSASPAPRTEAAPLEAPGAIAAEPASTGDVTGDPRGVPGGLPDGLIGSAGIVPDVPRPPAPMPTGPLPIGGRIKEPAKIHHVPPVDPVIAQQARVGGVVIIEAVIGTDGRVREARVLRSRPLLDQAALDAVRQWVFTPTTLNGAPVPVIMTVTVHFRLD